MTTLKTFTKEEVIALCEKQIAELVAVDAPKNQTDLMKIFTLGLSLDMSIIQTRVMREDVAGLTSKLEKND